MREIRPAQTSLKVDLTTGSVTKTLLVFAWPLMLSNLLQIIYNMVDMIVVGQFVGKTGLAAVSCGADLLHVVTSLIMGFASASQIIISQLSGKKDADGVRKTIGTMFTFCFLLSLVVTAVGLIFINGILNAMNVPAEAFAEAKAYSLCCFTGVFFIFGYNAVSSILRGMGDSKRPFVFVAIAAVMNLILDLVFVAGFHWDAFGAAFATVISQGVSFIVSLIYLYRKKEEFGFDFKLKSFMPDLNVLKVLGKLGVPMALQNSAVMLSKLFVNSYINSYGVVAAAVTGVGAKIGQCSTMVTNAMSMASTSMVGQSFGAGKLDRVKRTVYVTLFISIAFCWSLAVIMIFFPDQIFGIFNSDPEILELAHTYIPISVLMFNGFALRSPMLALVNGTGNPTLSLTIGILDGIVARVGLALFLGLYLKMGIMGFWLGDVFASQIPFFIGGIYFWSGMWKRKKIISI
ncbi:MAG: MATE family efflux transporter [Lachnospiraceae bacterium]|jgi:putative MATE family efflux protein|nr:MATE family efflux transporter [Lachnospiraceae bacterium]